MALCACQTAVEDAARERSAAPQFESPAVGRPSILTQLHYQWDRFEFVDPYSDGRAISLRAHAPRPAIQRVRMFTIPEFGAQTVGAPNRWGQRGCADVPEHLRQSGDPPGPYELQWFAGSTLLRNNGADGLADTADDILGVLLRCGDDLPGLRRSARASAEAEAVLVRNWKLLRPIDE